MIAELDRRYGGHVRAFDFGGRPEAGPNYSRIRSMYDYHVERGFVGVDGSCRWGGRGAPYGWESDGEIESVAAPLVRFCDWHTDTVFRDSMERPGWDKLRPFGNQLESDYVAAAAPATFNCSLPAGQYEVILLFADRSGSPRPPRTLHPQDQRRCRRAGRDGRGGRGAGGQGVPRPRAGPARRHLRARGRRRLVRQRPRRAAPGAVDRPRAAVDRGGRAAAARLLQRRLPRAAAQRPAAGAARRRRGAGVRHAPRCRSRRLRGRGPGGPARCRQPASPTGSRLPRRRAAPRGCPRSGCSPSTGPTRSPRRSPTSRSAARGRASRS